MLKVKELNCCSGGSGTTATTCSSGGSWGTTSIGKSIKFVQTPVESTRIVVAASGTNIDAYPATNRAFATPFRKGVTYPSRPEYNEGSYPFQLLLMLLLAVLCHISNL